MTFAVAWLAACTGASPPPAWRASAYAPRAGGALDVAALTDLGRTLFFDATLSASGRVSCASCHDPGVAFGPPNDRPVQLAGRDGATPGLRAAPSLRYLQTVPPFTEHHYENEGDDSVDAGPTGGHTWDGRASSAHEQAALPLLSPLEMANASKAEVARKLAEGASAGRLRRVFGDDVFASAETAFDAAAMALEVYQQTPAEFAPYTSKYDEVLRGRAELSAAEARGRAAFDDPARGNCASCHPSQPGENGHPLFSDFGHVAIGVPRNAALAANADRRFFDLGLCGPLRRDLAARDELCGRFRTPSLRNVAARRAFFHNGFYADLRDAVRFYALRDVAPERIYPRRADGSVARLDDLPERFHANVDVDPPFDRARGDAPALGDAEIDDIVAFLRTLTDADVEVGVDGAGRR